MLGVTPAPGAEGFIPSPSTKHGDWSQQGPVGTGTWAEFHPREGAVLPWVPIPGVGRWTPAHCPVPGLTAGWFPAPRTIPGAVTSGGPQLHPACPTDAPFRSPAARTEPSAEPRKALGRQLPAEPPATSSDQPRRSFTLAEPSGLPEPGGREGWSSSLPRLGRNVPVALPRRVSHGGEVGAGTLPTPPNTEGRDARGAHGCLIPLLACSWSPWDGGQQGAKHAVGAGCRWGLPSEVLWAVFQWHLPVAYTDNRLMARLAAPRGTGRRALSVHEEQLREPECPAELGSKLSVKWDPKPSLHLLPTEVGGGVPYVCWCCLAQLVGDKTMALPHWEVPEGNSALGSVPAGARPLCPTLTWAWVVSSSGHRSPAPAAFACAQAQDQARIPLRDGG